MTGPGRIWEIGSDQIRSRKPRKEIGGWGRHVYGRVGVGGDGRGRNQSLQVGLEGRMSTGSASFSMSSPLPLLRGDAILWESET